MKILTTFKKVQCFCAASLALAAAGSAGAKQHDWQGTTGNKLYWEDSASWSNYAVEENLTEWIINVQGAQVGFKTAYAENSTSDTAPLVILSGNETPVEFIADDDSSAYGLTKNGNLNVSAWWAGNGNGGLTIEVIAKPLFRAIHEPSHMA